MATPEELSTPFTLAEENAGTIVRGTKITSEGEVFVPSKVPVDNRGGK